MNSLRREYLDELLNKYKSMMYGKVLDLGGKKINRRGSFIPPKNKIISWQYLNTDETTNPDFCCSVEEIPLERETIDVVVMTELIEYLPKPIKALKEVYRVLKKNGHIFLSVPFLHPLHGDNWADRARYTPVLLKEMIESSSLTIISIEPMGSVGSVIFDILRTAIGHASKKGNKRISNLLLKIFKPLFKLIDRLCSFQKNFINTGYFLVITKD